MFHQSPTFRLSLAACAVTALFSTAAHADLTPLDPIDFNGTGLGSVNTILTIQSPANTDTENGTVVWDGTSDMLSGSNVLSGNSQTQTRTLGDLGVTSADSLRVVFNAAEPGNAAAAGISLESLTFTAYTPTGTGIFSASLLAPIDYADTFTGTGNSGFVFGLTSAQASSFANAVSASGFSFASIRAGLGASASGATGGHETFFIADAGGVTAVPEPQTYALLLAGLGAIGFAARRRS